jgi:hypothetical protein
LYTESDVFSTEDKEVENIMNHFEDIQNEEEEEVDDIAEMLQV